MAPPLLVVEGLKTHFHLRSGVLKAVDDVSFAAESGKVLSIVGESGSGKSVTAMSVMRLIDPPGKIEAGRVMYRDRDLMTLSEGEMQSTIRGNRIGMVFQDPVTSLNPAFTIGDQIAESLIVHKRLTASQARTQVFDLLKLVGLPHAAERYDSYPHEFSGGMCQRVVIAAAIACEPDLLIADEPTTALDVTIQAQILRLLNDLRQRLNSSLILITHDLGVVAAMADEVMVMYAGKVVEQASVEQIFQAPRHPYTAALLDALPERAAGRARLPVIAGVVPGLADRPQACLFQPRCTRAQPLCAATAPGLDLAGRLRCHFPLGLD